MAKRRNEVRSQRAALAQAQQTLPELQKTLAQQGSPLTALAGRRPSEEVHKKLELSQLAAPSDLPIGAPSRLVVQRADIKAAAANSHAATAQIGVADAAPHGQRTPPGGETPLSFRSAAPPNLLRF